MCIKQQLVSGNLQMFIRCFCNNKVYHSLKSYRAHQLTQGHTIYKKLIDISQKIDYYEKINVLKNYTLKK
jgi:hypothetical protein